MFAGCSAWISFTEMLLCVLKNDNSYHFAAFQPSTTDESSVFTLVTVIVTHSQQDNSTQQRNFYFYNFISRQKERTK